MPPATESVGLKRRQPNIYGKLSDDKRDTTKQVSFESDSSRLKSRSHPNLNFTTEKKGIRLPGGPFQISNGISASLALSTSVVPHTSVGGADAVAEGGSRSPLTWNDVVRIAETQNQKMYGNNRRKNMSNKQDAGKAEKSLCCLSLNNPIRKACIRIVEWK